MLLIVAFFAIVVSCAAENARRHGEPCPPASSNIDALTLFRQKTRFDLLRINYNMSHDGSNAMCVKIRRDTATVEGHTMMRNFTYRNMSSTRRQMARALINMTFYKGNGEFDDYSDEDTSMTSARSEQQKYTRMSSTINKATPGFSLPAPKWTFLYSTKKCFVVKVPGTFINDCNGSQNAPSDSNSLRRSDLSSHTWDCAKPRCELWARPDHRQGELRNSYCCEQFFNSACSTSTIVRVYDDKCHH
ncbi:uncharacterized protein [Dermacentor albipictus]|uniref:uncharacterized protein n=1 Tax=Dermacentor albipictus TaxID=60249 RepID=UPI0031FBD46A